MAHIPVSAGMIDVGIQRTLETGAEKVKHIVEFVGPRIVCFEGKVPHASAQLYLQRVVIRAEFVGIDVFVGKTRILTSITEDVGSVCIESSEIHTSLHVVTVVSNIIHRQDRVARDLLLDAEQAVVSNLVFRVLRKCSYVLRPGG